MPSFFLSLIWRDVLEVHFSDRDIFHRKPRWLINGYCQLVGCSLIYCLAEAGAYPQLPTQLFSNLIYYGHSELSREEKSKFEIEEKSSVCYWKGRFAGVPALKMQLSVINWTFFLKFKFWFFFARQLRMTIIDCCIKTLKSIVLLLVYLGCISLRMIKKTCCVGSCAPASVKYVC